MLKARSSAFFLMAAAAAIASTLALPALGQEVLYDNGPDGENGYYHVNFGSAVTNSFALSSAATLTSATITLYTVDDRNPPLRLKWSITTEPFGGTVLGEGFEDLALLQNPYLTNFLFFAWQMRIAIPNISLPTGTYYLQIQDVVTRWDSFAFWAQSSGGNSQGYYQAIGKNGAGGISEVPSETFSIDGEWSSQQVRRPATVYK